MLTSVPPLSLSDATRLANSASIGSNVAFTLNTRLHAGSLSACGEGWGLSRHSVLATADEVAFATRSLSANPYFNPECECFTVLLLNTRRRVKAHQIVSFGTHDTILVHPLTVFRLAVITSAAALVMMHNHPSGEPTPSEADIKVTRDLIRAGQLLKIEVLDHVIIGNPKHASLRELGFFYTA
jgi:DNA repair protein RadC